MDEKEKQIAEKILKRVLTNIGIEGILTDTYDGLLQFIYDEIKAIPMQLPVSVQEGDFKLLTLFMANSTARISNGSKWIVRDDNLWFVYGQPHGKRVQKLLETDKFVKALALLSD